jgi:hypothetical protein
MKVICAQPFLNEAEIFKIKLHTLRDIVDEWIVVEADRTYTGIAKGWNFPDVDAPVRHYRVSLPELANSPWVRENIQRSVLNDTIVKSAKPGDVVLCVDTDEIPAPDVVERFLATGDSVRAMEMDHLLFFLNRLDPTIRWTYPKICRITDDKFPPNRNDETILVLPNAGWHLEYFGQLPEILYKANATSHAFDPGAAIFKEGLRNGERLGLEHTVEYGLSRLPKCVQENLPKYDAMGWISKETPCSSPAKS